MIYAIQRPMFLNWNQSRTKELPGNDPSPFWGQFVKDALAGKQFEMQKEC